MQHVEIIHSKQHIDKRAHKHIGTAYLIKKSFPADQPQNK